MAGDVTKDKGCYTREYVAAVTQAAGILTAAHPFAAVHRFVLPAVQSLVEKLQSESSLQDGGV